MPLCTLAAVVDIPVLASCCSLPPRCRSAWRPRRPGSGRQSRSPSTAHPGQDGYTWDARNPRAAQQMHAIVRQSGHRRRLFVDLDITGDSD